MKKRLISVMLCGATLALTLSGCGKAKTSAEYKLDTDKLVTSVCDYSSLEIGLSSEYTVTDEQISSNLESMAEMCTIYQEVTDRDTVEDGDYVLADYTGTQDGVAFDGGSATDQYLLISDGNGYIDGFTDGIPGMKVGETKSYDVTFPDPYTLNEDLSGATVQFEFTIHGIYTAETATWDTLTDEAVYNNFYNYYQVSTKEELETYVTDYMNQSNEYYENQEELQNMKQYMIDNSEVTVPEDYLELRVNEYIDSFTENYVTETGATLESYLSETYGYTVDEAKSQWTEYMTDVIKTELIFEKIAEDEGLTIDEDDYSDYVDNLVSNYSYDDETALYEKFGVGDAEAGETYIRRMYLINKAIDLVMDNCTFTYDPSLNETTDETSTEAVTETETE